MISVSCRSCGSDLEDPRDAVCMHCGLPVGGRRPPDEPKPEPRRTVDENAANDDAPPRDPRPRPDPPLSTESMWKLGVWGAMLVSIVAVAAIVVTLLSAATRTPEPESSVSTPETATAESAATEAGPAPLTPEFDPPLTSPITIDHPDLNVLIREHLDDGVLTFRLDGDYCGRGEGTITARGVITNYSMARQRFDYTITVDLIRAWNRSVIGTLETTIEGLAPLESTEWSVEMVSSRVSSIDCNVISITATPAG